MEIDHIPLKVQVSLGSVSLQSEVVSLLQTGDILLLDQKLDEKLAIKLGGETVFKGIPGLEGIKKAVKIDE
ncbi:MAG: hypothetical protein K940chlam9_01360 [Chlamydiae bacterium]|nr:hypothetical protein [Chlamydiota bacterium]